MKSVCFLITSLSFWLQRARISYVLRLIEHNLFDRFILANTTLRLLQSVASTVFESIV